MNNGRGAGRIVAVVVDRDGGACAMDFSDMGSSCVGSRDPDHETPMWPRRFGRTQSVTTTAVFLLRPSFVADIPAA
jgi:hypothetical protein